MPTNTNNQAVSFFTVFEALKRRKLFIVIPVLLMTAGFALYAYRLPAKYRASAFLASDPVVTPDYVKASRPSFTTMDVSTTARMQEQTRLIREFLYSPKVMGTVIREFKLPGHQEEKISESALADMEGRTRIELEGMNAFRLMFEDGDRQQVAKVTNRLAELFMERVDSARAHRTGETAEFITGELGKVRAKLAEQEEQIRLYKTRSVHSSPEMSGSNMRMYETTQVQLATKNEEIANDQAQRAALTEEIKGLEAQGVHQSAPMKEKTAMDTRLDELRLSLKQAQGRYTENHPEVARLQNEVRDVERIVASQPAPVRTPSPVNMRYLQLKAEMQAIDQRLASYRQEQKRLASQTGMYASRVASTPQHESTLTVLMRDYSTTKMQYQGLLEKQNDAKLAEDLESADKGMNYRLVEPARVPSAPFSPQRGRIILLGLAGSLGLGLALAFFAEQLDTSVTDIDEFQSFTNVPVLTVIPSIPSEPQQGIAKDKSNLTVPLRYPRMTGPGEERGRSMDVRHLQKNHIITLSDTGTVAAEQYGILALKLRQQLGEGGSKVLAMTSAVGGEGKTTTAINLSVALAGSAECRVLLIECDLRKSRVHEYLGFKPAKGFSDLLLNPDDDINSYIWKVNDLHVIPGGTMIQDPVGVLASRRTRALLARLREQFQIIVLDSPPILPIADSHIIAGMSDGVVLVMRARSTRRELFQRAVESAYVPNLLGVVLNDVDYLRSRYAYAYQYYEKHYLAAK